MSQNNTMINIEITDDALACIKNNDASKVPTIFIIKAGCAGNMLTISLLDKNIDNEIFNVQGIEIAISKDVLKSGVNDVSISVKKGLSNEVIVTNNSAKAHCRCGKSFVL